MLLPLRHLPAAKNVWPVSQCSNPANAPCKSSSVAAPAAAARASATASTPTAATATGAVSLSGKVGTDEVLAASTATLVSADTSTSGQIRAGSYVQTVSAGLTGADAGNYSFAGSTTPTANYVVNQKNLVISATAENKIYDATTAASASLSSNMISGDSLSLSNSNANFDNKQGNSTSPWQAWSASQQQAHLAAGRAVFVDFTAAWCVTCQYNKKTTLAHAPLLAEFAARKVVLMRADWTRRDPAITQALTDLGRSGVPVYALYSPKQAVVLLSELPSVAEVQAALQKLPQ